MNHKYSTYLLLGLGIIALAGIVLGINSKDVDELCSTNNKTLLRWNNEWVCANTKGAYGMYSSTETQTIPLANTPYAITFNYTEDSYNITKSGNDTNFTVGQNGNYLVEISAIFTSTLANKHVDVWVSKNGINIPRSNTHSEIRVANAEYIVTVPFIIELTTNDKLTIKWSSDSTAMGTEMEAISWGGFMIAWAVVGAIIPMYLLISGAGRE